MKQEVKWKQADGQYLASSNQRIALIMTLFLLVLGAVSLAILINSPA